MNRLGGKPHEEKGNPTKIAGLYDLEETLGRGHFAVVKLARHVFTGEKVAVKVIDKTKLDPVSQDHLYQEVRCMKLVQHPNVVRLYEVIDTNSKLYLILELGDGGDLYDYIMKHDAGLSEDYAREYFGQIVRAISFCHKLHVVHRDLKPENVVFFERLGVVKLTDFGFSNRFNPGQKLETSCGSLAYSAPEILLGDSYDAPAVDVWSLGVILYMLVVGQAPFQEANDSETLTMIMDVKYNVPNHVTEECKRLIGRMLVREPEKRATLEEIATDPWLAPAMSDDNAAVPLVSREDLCEEDHNFIITKMVNGKIASKEDILEALDKDEYNHITATYFLLAERKLRLSRQPKKQQPPAPTSNIVPPLLNVERCQDLDQSTTPGNTRVNQSLLSMSRNPAGDVASHHQRSRKCSIVTEEEDDEDDQSSGSHQDRRGSRSEGKLNLAVQELRRESIMLNEASTAPTPLQLKPTPQPHPSPAAKTLPSSIQSLQPSIGLHGISEESISTLGESTSSTTSTHHISSSSHSSRLVSSMTITSNVCSSSTFIHQKRNTFRKTRTASVSSSDASDEDETRSRRGSTKSLHRRSSRDSNDPGGGGGGGNGPSGPGGDGNNGGNNNNNNTGDDNGDGNNDNKNNGDGNTNDGNNSNNNNNNSNNNGKQNSIGNGSGNSSSCNSTPNLRHKRRTTETRLRESQSLNRITEVQECCCCDGVNTPNSNNNNKPLCIKNNIQCKENNQICNLENNNNNQIIINNGCLDINDNINECEEVVNGDIIDGSNETSQIFDKVQNNEDSKEEDSSEVIVGSNNIIINIIKDTSNNNDEEIKITTDNNDNVNDGNKKNECNDQINAIENNENNIDDNKVDENAENDIKEDNNVTKLDSETIEIDIKENNNTINSKENDKRNIFCKNNNSQNIVNVYSCNNINNNNKYKKCSTSNNINSCSSVNKNINGSSSCSTKNKHSINILDGVNYKKSTNNTNNNISLYNNSNNKKSNSKNNLISRYLYLQKKIVLPFFGLGSSSSSKKSTDERLDKEGRLYKAKSCSEVEKTSCTLLRYKCAKHHKSKENMLESSNALLCNNMLECSNALCTNTVVGNKSLTLKKFCNLC